MTSPARRRALPVLLATLTLAVSGSAAVAGAAPAPTAPAPLVTSPGDAVPGQYLVVLKGDVGTSGAQKLVAAAAARGRSAGGVVRHQYHSVLNAYAATLSGTELDSVRRDPSVAYVQPNYRYTAAGTYETAPSWGLDRIDQRTKTLNDKYYYSNTGSGVDAYILDTGIMNTHPDFSGRIGTGTNTVDGGDTEDCDGHGTHVSGIVGGEVYGVAKKVTLHPVKVLDCDGTGSSETVIAGLEWVKAQHTSGHPAVVNMSLGSDDPGRDTTLESSVQDVIDDGVTVVLAAGNSGGNACSYTPGSVKAAIVVGASTKTDKKAGYSNYGSCVDIWAPGSGITSDWIGRSSNGGYYVQDESGTSMAAPHVAGAAALYLQKHPTAKPSTVAAALLAAATKKAVTVSSSTKSPLLFAVQKQTPPAATTSPTKILPGTALLTGKKICSPSKKYCLTQRASDGHLILYRVATKKTKATTIWSNKTDGGSWTTVKTTGNVASQSVYGRDVWSTATSGVGAAELRVRDRGYLALVTQSDQKTVWHTTPAQS